MNNRVRDACQHGEPSPSGEECDTARRVRRAHAGWRTAVSLAHRSVVRTLAIAALSTILVGCGSDRSRPASRLPEDGEPLGILPAEFERQEAFLLAWPRFAEARASPNAKSSMFNEDQFYGDIVAAVWNRIQTIILVEDSRSENRVTGLLSDRQIPPSGVRFVHVPFESEWIRDYGPMGVRASDGSCTLIDAEYVEGPVGVYPHEDRMPSVLGKLLAMPTVRAPLTIQHGNLLSNGRGLCLVTEKIVEENVGRGYDADDVRRVLRKFYGAKEVVFLEMLEGEPTGHVDMFATFTSADTVVVGEYPTEYDPVNAVILDRNAERLSRSASGSEPLKVVRVPMPPRVPSPGGDLWTTYTNVAYANGTLLVPEYPRWAPEVESAALDAYRRLLPDWTIAKINAVPVLRMGGSIHCVTMNLAGLGTRQRKGSDVQNSILPGRRSTK